MTLNKVATVLALLFLTTSILIFSFFPKEKSDWLVVYWGIIGSNASVLGIVYTIVALNRLRNESQLIIETTLQTKQRMGEFNGIADIARAIKLVQEVQGYARSHKYEVGIIRLQELKTTASQLRMINSGVAEIPDLTETIFNLNRLIGSMEKEISSKTTNLKIVFVNKTLEEISDLFVEAQTKLIMKG